MRLPNCSAFDFGSIKTALKGLDVGMPLQILVPTCGLMVRSGSGGEIARFSPEAYPQAGSRTSARHWHLRKLPRHRKSVSYISMKTMAKLLFLQLSATIIYTYEYQAGVEYSMKQILQLRVRVCGVSTGMPAKWV